VVVRSPWMVEAAKFEYLEVDQWPGRISIHKVRHPMIAESLTVMVLYGYPKDVEKTDKLAEEVMVEIRRATTPVILMGDWNLCIEESKILRRALWDGTIHMVGSWEEVTSQPTTTSMAESHRAIDLIFVTENLVSWVDGFKVHEEMWFPTHRLVTCELLMPNGWYMAWPRLPNISEQNEELEYRSSGATTYREWSAHWAGKLNWQHKKDAEKKEAEQTALVQLRGLAHRAANDPDNTEVNDRLMVAMRAHDLDPELNTSDLVKICDEKVNTVKREQKRKAIAEWKSRLRTAKNVGMAAAYVRNAAPRLQATVRDMCGYQYDLVLITGLVALVPKGAVENRDPSSLRPVSVFSVVARGLTSCISEESKGWLQTIAPPGQTSVHGGVMRGIARVCIITERVHLTGEATVGFSLDMAKLFNRLPRQHALRMLQRQGLQERLIARLARWLVTGVTWNLPGKAQAAAWVRQRGGPQGLGSTNLVSEGFVSPMMWSAQAALGETGLATTFVDDLTAGGTCAHSTSIAEYSVMNYLDAVDIPINEKSIYWNSTDMNIDDTIAGRMLRCDECFKTLGATFAPNKVLTREHMKLEAKRWREVEERASLAASLPLNPFRLGAVLASSVMTAYYIGEPMIWSRRLTTTRRRIMSRALHKGRYTPCSAWEIPFALVATEFLDPYYHSILSHLVLVRHAAEENMGMKLIARAMDSVYPVGHLTWAVDWLETKNVEVTEEGLRHPRLGELRWDTPLKAWRKRIKMFIWKGLMRDLAERRPAVYGGLDIINRSWHRRFFEAQTTLGQNLIWRWWQCALWTACTTTYVSGQAVKCSCGDGDENEIHIAHICRLWDTARDMLPPAHWPPHIAVMGIAVEGMDIDEKEWAAWNSTLVKILILRHETHQAAGVDLQAFRKEKVQRKPDVEHGQIVEMNGHRLVARPPVFASKHMPVLHIWHCVKCQCISSAKSRGMYPKGKCPAENEEPMELGTESEVGPRYCILESYELWHGAADKRHLRIRVRWRCLH